MYVSLMFVIGLMVAAVLIVILFKYANKDGKVKTEYDERQKTLRGNAYKYAFYTEALAQILIMLLFMAKIELPIENYALLFIGIILGCIVLCGYCIWNDVYWGLNNDRKRYHIILIVVVVLNALSVIMSVVSGDIFQNGKIGMPMLNIIVLIMIAVVYLELLIKKIADKKAVKEEE